MNQATDLPQFQYLGKLGTGGTAEVHKVVTQDNKTAALKTKLQTSELSDAEFYQLALREKTLLENLDYPGIVKVYDVQLDDPYYICLEYCNGKTLEQYKKFDNLTLALNILSSIAVNLEYLHQHSIVHADLKPDNIFMPEDLSSLENGKLSYTKLSDFSLGKFEQEENSVRAGLGTIGYMAPETIKEKTVSHQSDLFALGVIAYQILTGQHPFITSDSDPVQINGRILEETPEPIQNFRDDISEEIIELIDLLLHKDASQRPTSAWEVCVRLAQAGATYPYKKAMHPKYSLNLHTGYTTNKNIFTNFDSYLDTITDQSNSQLRYIVSYNFQRDNLEYNMKHFRFKNMPLVPISLINHELKKLMFLSYTKIKSTIEKSLAVENKNLLSLILPHLLSTSFLKRISLQLAKQAYQQEDFTNATHLYLQAGELLKAEDCAYQSAMKFKNENQYTEAFRVLGKVISFANLIDKKFEIKSLLMLKADLLKETGKTGDAEFVYNEIISLYQTHSDDELLAETYKDLGDLCKMKKKPKEGIVYLEKALDIFKKLENELEISKTYNNLGNIYAVGSEFNQAIKYFRKALHIQKNLSAEVEVASTLNNIGVIHAMTSRFHRALKIFNISLKIQKGIGNKGEIARTLNNLGYCYEVLGNTSMAVETLQESIQYNKEIDSKREILFNLENLTAIMFATGKLKESIVYLKEGITLATELNDYPHIGMFNLYMGSVLTRMGKLKEASKSFIEVENILDTIEDDSLLAQLYIEKAHTAIYLNISDLAKTYIQKVEQINEKLKDKTISLKILLLKISSTNDILLVPEAERIINELDIIKEKAVLNGMLIMYKLQIDNSYAVDEQYAMLTETVAKSNEHIEQCKLLNALASYELHKDNIENASRYIEESIVLAKSRGLVLDLFNALVIRGSVLSKQNNIELCYATYKQGLETAKSIFSQLESEGDKIAFQNKKEFTFLVSEIKKLSQVISRKKEQV